MTKFFIANFSLNPRMKEILLANNCKSPGRIIGLPLIFFDSCKEFTKFYTPRHLRFNTRQTGGIRYIEPRQNQHEEVRFVGSINSAVCIASLRLQGEGVSSVYLVTLYATRPPSVVSSRCSMTFFPCRSRHILSCAEDENCQLYNSFTRHECNKQQESKREKTNQYIQSIQNQLHCRNNKKTTDDTINKSQEFIFIYQHFKLSQI